MDNTAQNWIDLVIIATLGGLAGGLLNDALIGLAIGLGLLWLNRKVAIIGFCLLHGKK